MEIKHAREEVEHIGEADILVRLAAQLVESRARCDQLLMEVADIEGRMKELDNEIERTLTEGLRTDLRIQVIRDVIGRAASPLVVRAQQ